MAKKDILKAVIMDNQRALPKITLTRRKMPFNPSACYVLVGLRRAGKSYTLAEEAQQAVARGEMDWEDVLMVNFEDERVADIRAAELGLLLEAYAELFPNRRPRLYLDEIQNIDGWEKFARRMADAKYRVMITGSNAKMFSQEIYTTLGGRYIPREIFPFSFAEYLTHKAISLDPHTWRFDNRQLAMVREAFRAYFRNGGLAEAFDRPDAREYLNALYQKIILGDITERNRLRNPRAFRLLGRKLAESLTQPVGVTRLANVLQSSGERVSTTVLKDYLQYMEEGYLTFSLTNFKSPFSERETARKRYFADNGLLNLFFIDEKARLLENLVAVELNRRFRPQGEEPRVFYYNHNVEVDFVVPEQRVAIQVCADLSDTATREREVKSLKRFLASATGQGYAGLVLTLDCSPSDDRDIDGLRVMPVYEWLLVSGQQGHGEF